MKKNLILIFYFLSSILNGQTPRVPVLADGNFLLFKNDSIVVSFYWELDYLGELDCRGKEEYEYALHIHIHNLTKDTIAFKFKLSTIEIVPEKHFTLDTSNDNSSKYSFDKLEPTKQTGWAFSANCKDIVDFKFEEFLIKFKTKTLNITQQANKRKQSKPKELVKLD